MGGSMLCLLRLRHEDVAKTGSKPLSKGKFLWFTARCVVGL